MNARLRLVERQPLHVQIAAAEFTEQTADDLADHLAKLVAANAAPALDLFRAALHHASTGQIGAPALLEAVQRHRVFG